MRQAHSPRGDTRPCAFCAIVAGQAPAEVVHRSPRLVAFLDAHPLFPGHVLLLLIVHVHLHLIPRQRYPDGHTAQVGARIREQIAAQDSGPGVGSAP